MFRYLLPISVMAAAVLSSFSVLAQQTYVAGKDYLVIEQPVRPQNPDKIEVTEVFWYGCGHCNNLEPLLQRWSAQQADDVEIVHSPAMWNGTMQTHARLFYTAKALGLADKMHQTFFDAIHKERKRLLKPEAIFPLFEKHGVDRATFDKTFESFGVNAMVKKADARARGYGIAGTPEMIVNGKYRVSSRTAGNHERMLKIVDFLVAQERAAAKS